MGLKDNQKQQKRQHQQPLPELCRVEPGNEGAPGEADSDRSAPSIPRPPFSSITFFFSLANILKRWVGEEEFHTGVRNETPLRRVGLIVAARCRVVGCDRN